jgi:ribonucleoside-diphosphate reductase alpha chain
LWHDSEVAAIAYAVQNIIALRADRPTSGAAPVAAPEVDAALAPPVMAGKKCSECGAHAVIRKDGCDYCTQCGHLGVCG